MQTQLPRALRSFGLNVRKRREASGLTQERAGEKANLDPTYISGIERGNRNVSLRNVEAIAQALGISIAELMEGV